MNHKQLASYIQPPCLQHPADWVNPKRHAWTAHQCRSCSSLQVCAGSALRHRPSYGMWAGVWINGDFTAKQHLLGRQHPDPDPGLESELIEVQPDPPPPLPPAPRHAPGRRRPRRVGALCTAAPAPMIAARITARASGHCEIMAPACTYGQSAIFTRRRGATPPTLGSPADAIAACHNCIELIEHTDIPTALDLGYIVDPRSCTSTTAVLWRQRRWVYLDAQGQLHPTGGPDLVAIA